MIFDLDMFVQRKDLKQGAACSSAALYGITDDTHERDVPPPGVCSVGD